MEPALKQRTGEPVAGSRKRQRPRTNAARLPGARRTTRSLDRLEADREALLRRLSRLDSGAKLLPGYRSALTLLNSRFRRALLQAAQFMIEVLERIPY